MVSEPPREAVGEEQPRGSFFAHPRSASRPPRQARLCHCDFGDLVARTPCAKVVARSNTSPSGLPFRKGVKVMLITPVQRTRFPLVCVAHVATVLLLLLVRTAHAGDGSPTIDANAGRKQLNLASAMILAHQPGRAVTEILDPLIARYVASYSHSKDIIYSTSDPSQTLYYLTLAARNQHNAKVIDSTWADADYQKGFALVSLGRIDEARDALKRAIALSPANGSYWNELAFTYQFEKNFVKAIELYKCAEMGAQLQQNARLKSDQQRLAWRGQAYALVELGRLDEAEALYKRCLELEPHDAMAQNQLAYVAKLRSTGDRAPLFSAVTVTPQGDSGRVASPPVGHPAN
jgi:hypothetical protein